MSPKQPVQTVNISLTTYMTLIYLAQQSKTVLSVTPEAVNLEKKLWLDNLSSFFACAGSVALHENKLWKYGAYGAAADRSQGSRSESCDFTTSAFRSSDHTIPLTTTQYPSQPQMILANQHSYWSEFLYSGPCFIIAVPEN